MRPDTRRCESHLSYKNWQGEGQKNEHDFVGEGRETYAFVTIAEIRFSPQISNKAERVLGGVVVVPPILLWQPNVR